MTSTQPRVRHKVIPFHLMTNQQAAEHMVRCHGFDEAWMRDGDYAAGLGRPITDADALAYWAEHAWTFGAGEHAAEHTAEWDGVGGGIPHTHTKDLPGVG